MDGGTTRAYNPRLGDHSRRDAKARCPSDKRNICRYLKGGRFGSPLPTFRICTRLSFVRRSNWPSRLGANGHPDGGCRPASSKYQRLAGGLGEKVRVFLNGFFAVFGNAHVQHDSIHRTLGLAQTALNTAGRVNEKLFVTLHDSGGWTHGNAVTAFDTRLQNYIRHN